ncbi:MAG: hypothetical protein OEX81_01430 [Candidatus Pacebacteria bacterium]|nr:hypothetical protein [Candidatus Paceibacterota bacterium]
MVNRERQLRKEHVIPLFLTTAIVTLLLMAGGLTSFADTGREDAINPSAAPTPAFNVDNGFATATPEGRPLVTYTPTPNTNRIIETPIPNAGPIVNPDGSVSSHQ